MYHDLTGSLKLIQIIFCKSCNHFAVDDGDGCFTLTIFFMSCESLRSVSLPCIALCRSIIIAFPLHTHLFSDLIGPVDIDKPWHEISNNVALWNM